MSPDDRQRLIDAFDSNWIAPVGPELEAFERELAAEVGVAHAVALSSGTAALHLGLIAAGVRAGDRVITSTLTFAATANAILYVGAEPVFVDVSPGTWTLDPGLLAAELARQARLGRRVGAIITVDLYGQCADYAAISGMAMSYGVPIVEDAAEALGAVYGGGAAGSFGTCAAFSFNGNKIITTSGGGMLVSDDRGIVERARHLSTQARAPVPHYEHAEVGYNYRMSNLLAAIGRGQLRSLSTKVAARRAINARYRSAFEGVAGLTFMPEASYGRSTCWLTCILMDRARFGADREWVRLHLESLDIETRAVWKPLHLQRAFRGCTVRGGEVAETLFEEGLCLPSGSSLREAEQDRVIAGVRESREAAAARRKRVG